MMTDDELRALLAGSRDANTWTCAGCDRRYDMLANARTLLGRPICMSCFARARSAPAGGNAGGNQIPPTSSNDS